MNITTTTLVRLNQHHALDLSIINAVLHKKQNLNTSTSHPSKSTRTGWGIDWDGQQKYLHCNARLHTVDPHEVTYEMVQAYRSNPYPATGMTPCRPLMNLDIRSKLDHFPAEIHSQDQLVWMHDGLYIQKHKDYLDKCIMQDCTHWKLRTMSWWKSELGKKAKSLMNHICTLKFQAIENHQSGWGGNDHTPSPKCLLPVPDCALA